MKVGAAESFFGGALGGGKMLNQWELKARDPA
jgi:hypothetical protein